MRFPRSISWPGSWSGSRPGPGAGSGSATRPASDRPRLADPIHPSLADAQQLGARLPALLVAAERVAATVAQGVHGRRRAGMGDSFWQYRQALPGEPASRIDWRQSARSSRTYVRETEWEAAQSVHLWQDPSASMRWGSGPSLPLKAERAELLLLALASLLLRGGEHVRLLPAGGLVSGQAALARLAAQLILQPAPPAADDQGLPPATVELPRHARVVLIGDMLSGPEAIASLFARLSAIPVGCTVLQILDPAETALPYEGHVRFEGLEGEASFLAPRAQDLAQVYDAAMASHQQHLQTLCSGAGFGLIRHSTAQPPAVALLALHQALHQDRNTQRAMAR